jgi:hypothetical protein
LKKYKTFKVFYGNGKEKIISAKSLEDAESKAPQSWTDIVYMNIKDGICEY